MNVLSIETSCDETAAAIISLDGSQASVRASIVSSQAALHAKWGGVVPDLASREHIQNIVPVLTETLDQAKMTPADIDLLAVTQGPGLMPALLIGVSTAKLLSFIWQKPLLGIQHLEGHIYANLIGNDQDTNSKVQTNSNDQVSNPKDPGSRFEIQDSRFNFPLLALVVSGGHTELVLMRDHFQYEVLGETQDDASGEAFDKVAKLLGLPYPGGPVVAKRADLFRSSNVQDTHSKIQTNPKDPIKKNQKGLFPRPMLDSDNFDFSFSGLKTAVLYYVQKNAERKTDEAFIDSVCHEFQEAVVDVLVGKTRKALELYSPKTFVIAGGVSANLRLREQLQAMLTSDFPDTQFLTPEFTYSLDNAAMIGSAALFRYAQMNETDRAGLDQSFLIMEPDANLPFQNLNG